MAQNTKHTPSRCLELSAPQAQQFQQNRLSGWSSNSNASAHKPTEHSHQKRQRRAHKLNKAAGVHHKHVGAGGKHTPTSLLRRSAKKVKSFLGVLTSLMMVCMPWICVRAGMGGRGEGGNITDTTAAAAAAARHCQHTRCLHAWCGSTHSSAGNRPVNT